MRPSVNSMKIVRFSAQARTATASVSSVESTAMERIEFLPQKRLMLKNRAFDSPQGVGGDSLVIR
jgi:hypothetical protein